MVKNDEPLPCTNGLLLLFTSVLIFALVYFGLATHIAVRTICYIGSKASHIWLVQICLTLLC